MAQEQVRVHHNYMKGMDGRFRYEFDKVLHEQTQRESGLGTYVEGASRQWCMAKLEREREGPLTFRIEATQRTAQTESRLETHKREIEALKATISNLQGRMISDAP